MSYVSPHNTLRRPTTNEWIRTQNRAVVSFMVGLVLAGSAVAIEGRKISGDPYPDAPHKAAQTLNPQQLRMASEILLNTHNPFVQGATEQQVQVADHANHALVAVERLNQHPSN